MTGPFFQGELAALGYDKEVTFGTAVASAFWLPMASWGVKATPNNIYPKLIRNTRAGSTQVVRGIRKVNGPIGTPLYPDAGMHFFAGALGTEQYTTGATPTATGAIVAANPIVAGVTSFHNTVTLTVGHFVQVGVAGDKNAEVRKVATVSGSGADFTIGVDKAFRFAHPATSTVTNDVVSPFSHFIVLANTLPSFTLEKYMGLTGHDLQYAGMKVGKLDLKMATNAEIQAQYTFEGQQDIQNSSLGTPSMPADLMFGPTQIAVAIGGGAADVAIESSDFSWDNGVKAFPTFNAQSYPQTVGEFSTKVSFKATALLQALTGGSASQGYYADLMGTTTNAISLVITQDATHVLTLALPAGSLTMADTPIKLDDEDHYDLEFECILDSSSGNQFTATILNTNWLNY